MTRDKLREIHDLAQRQIIGATPDETLALVNHIVNLEWEGGCLAAEKEGLLDAIKAAGFRVTGSAFEPTLERIEQDARA